MSTVLNICVTFKLSDRRDTDVLKGKKCVSIVKSSTKQETIA